MLDRLLTLAFALTGSRAVSELIGERRANARYRKARLAHIKAGGIVATYDSAEGSTSFFL